MGPSTMSSAKSSSAPSATPSSVPSNTPSASPSTDPSAKPSTMPSTSPSWMPSSMLPALPSAKPSSIPSTKPSLGPSSMPLISPSSLPSTMPSAKSSSAPSATPPSVPSSVPSVLLSRYTSLSPAGRYYGYGDEFIEARRKLQKSPIAGTRRFDVSGGQLVALADDGSRFPAAISPNSDVVELIFVDEGDLRVIDIKQSFLMPIQAITPTNKPSKRLRRPKTPRSGLTPKSIQN